MHGRPASIRVRPGSPPRATYPSGVDPISEAISGVRAGRANGRRIAEWGAWGVRFPAFVGIGFHVVLRGTGWLIAGGIEPVGLRPGDVVVVPNGAEHGLGHAPAGLDALPVMTTTARAPDPRPADVEFLCGAYRLDRGQVHPFLRGLPDVIVVSPDHERRPELRSLVGLLEDDLSEARSGNWVTRSALVDLMLVHVLRQWQEEAATPDWPAVTDPGVVAALREIHGRPQHRWTLQQLTEAAGMSRTAFNRRFTALVGTPPMTYLTRCRLAFGARLLRQTGYPLAAIARRVGYSTEFAFAHAFRREYGLAPGRFRDHPDPIPRQSHPAAE
jgi:AraC-like DNA-binding protein